MTHLQTTERRAAAILFAIAASEGTWLWFSAHRSPWRFLRYEGFVGGSPGVASWTLAMTIAAAFVGYSAWRVPSVRSTLFSLSVLKVLAIAVAVAAGFCEETVFRKWVMDGFEHQSPGLQIAASAVTFGVVHGIWGLFRGSAAAAIGATVATAVLGAALAVVFLVGHRVLAPCVTAHGLINLFVEPGLVLGAVRGEFGIRLRA